MANMMTERMTDALEWLGTTAGVDIDDYRTKVSTWMRPAVLSHLRVTFHLTDREATAVVDEFLRRTE